MIDLMGYERLAQEALRDIIRLALERVAEEGSLPGEHRIYIKFKTQAPGVKLPERLVQQYPDEITIVLKQHFWDLVVGRDAFSVGLSFNQKPESLTVPYKAVVQFYDPGVSFVLAFPEPPTTDTSPLPAEAAPREHAVLQPKLQAAPEPKSAATSSADVVSLDAFRKK